MRLLLLFVLFSFHKSGLESCVCHRHQCLSSNKSSNCDGSESCVICWQFLYLVFHTAAIILLFMV